MTNIKDKTCKRCTILLREDTHNSAITATSESEMLADSKQRNKMLAGENDLAIDPPEASGEVQ